ncbi:MAG: DUF2284 domain-containing protein [Deltaproteobacteria bacterium]|nr:DUF2284 domain-containing protein [Deltaproteobacteria bacterium]
MARYARRAVELGAQGAKIVGPRAVRCAQWVRLKCQYGCDGYGGCHTCPPYSPTPERTRQVLDEYAHLLLVHVGRWRSASRIATRLEREIFLEGHHKAFAWGAGPCVLCRSCDPSGPCRHPDRARPSMEACGIDVFATARRAGFPIAVVRLRREQANYFALVGIE